LIFVDTGAFVARWMARDQHHAAAVRGWRRVAEQRLACVTTNHIVDETLTLLGRRAGHSFAAEKGATLLTSEALAIVRPGREDELAALALFEKYADQRVSFTDCLSFVTMRQRGLARAFTFDGHFRLVGLTVWPA
jgi:predicted nucleic acid-binding protein